MVGKYKLGLNRELPGAAVTYRADLGPGQRQMIIRSHDAGLKIFGGTLTPFEGAGYYTEAGEQVRQAVNQWIRTSGEFDGVVDFDRAIRDPQRRSRMLPVYDPEDHLHPNAAGYAAMANAVRIALLR